MILTLLKKYWGAPAPEHYKKKTDKENRMKTDKEVRKIGKGGRPIVRTFLVSSSRAENILIAN